MKQTFAKKPNHEKFRQPYRAFFLPLVCAKTMTVRVRPNTLHALRFGLGDAALHLLQGDS
jgi:hypothetical protein